MRIRAVESVEEIRSVLTDAHWRVRPPGNEVPIGFRGSLAGDVFASFARMTDGDDHPRRKQLAVDLIDSLDLNAIPMLTGDIVRRLHAAHPYDLQFLVPGMVVSALLGVPESRQRLVVEQVRTLVIAVRPAASAADHAAAIEGISRTVPVIADTLAVGDRDDIDVIASRISLVFQASDACAALIGNALVLLSEAGDPFSASARDIVRASMRDRIPVRSTSRFQANETAVLDLEAAHRQHPNAEWTFGFGPHACPARSIAVAIAVACIDAVISQRPFDPSAVRSTGREDLPNVWIPILTLETEHAT